MLEWWKLCRVGGSWARFCAIHSSECGYQPVDWLQYCAPTQRFLFPAQYCILYIELSPQHAVGGTACECIHFVRIVSLHSICFNLQGPMKQARKHKEKMNKHPTYSTGTGCMPVKLETTHNCTYSMVVSCLCLPAPLSRLFETKPQIAWSPYIAIVLCLSIDVTLVACVVE